MRLVLCCLCVVLAGCPASSETLDVPDQMGSGAGSPPAMCVDETDCELAAATCCECPSFAVGAGDPASRACTGVVCPDPEVCPANVRAACDEGQCVLACVAMACGECADGYAIDASGCLSCTCAAPALAGCTDDTDCVATRADCCGCEQGGVTVAVLASELGSYEAGLGCSGAPQCPGINACDATLAPRCLQGRCELSSGELPAGACGRPDLPACPSGTVCTVNASDLATLYGVGLCTAP